MYLCVTIRVAALCLSGSCSVLRIVNEWWRIDHFLLIWYVCVYARSMKKIQHTRTTFSLALSKFVISGDDRTRFETSRRSGSVRSNIRSEPRMMYSFKMSVTRSSNFLAFNDFNFFSSRWSSSKNRSGRFATCIFECFLEISMCSDLSVYAQILRSNATQTLHLDL